MSERRPGARARRVARWMVAVVVAAVALLGPAQAASAHASLTSSDPADGSVVATAPTRVSLTFSENVLTSLNSVRVFDANGRRVDKGETHHGTSQNEAIVDLDGGLAKGTYVVAWR